MASAQAVWGIDVGRCALKAIKLRPGGEGGVEILAHDFVEHARILSQPDADRPALISAALEKFLSRNDVSKDLVVVAVPGQHTLARFTKLPPVAPKRIPDIVRYEADQQIPFDMDEVIWDYQTFQQEDLPDIEVGIFAMKRELIREHLLYFEEASIEPIAVQSAPLAVYNAAHYDDALGSETTILLDIGADNTDLVIATPHSLWTRTIPIGGSNCTEALVKSFKLSFSKAENLKRTAETSKYRRQIFQAMRPVFADLVQELQRSIGFYSSTHRDAKVDKVVAVGNALKLPGLQKYLQQNLGMDVDCPKAFKNVASSPAATAGALSEQFLSFWVPYGLALQGADLAKVTSNLLPTEIAKQVVWRRKRPAFAAAAACLVLAGGGIWARHTMDMQALAESSRGADAANVSSVDEAARIVDNGPPSSDSPRRQAALVLEASKTLTKELNAYSGQGEAERSATEDLINIQNQKSLVMKINDLVHNSLQKPEGPLGEATTPEEFVQATQSIPRGERRVVHIKSMNMQYMADVNRFIWPESLVPIPAAINDPEGIQPGFKLTIYVTTPFQGTSPSDSPRNLVEKMFMTPLRENGQRPDQGMYIDRVSMINGARVDPPLEMPNFGATSARISGAVMMRGGPEVLQLDPLTEESIINDWEFEIWVDVILEDFPTQ